MNRPANSASPARRLWRVGLLIGAVLVLAMIARPWLHLLQTASQDVSDRPATPSGFIDDASAMNQTAVHQIWPVPDDSAAAEAELAQLLRRARRDRLKVSIAGARHSMGGHVIAPDGIVIDMRPFRSMRLEDDGQILHVQAGAIWDDVLEYLDPAGRSVAVMQSNDSFSVGGSISVNCHGWQYGKPPIASTVESFRLMTADGRIRTCSRTENQELFSLALGGYGLFGIILDARLRTVPNERYQVHRVVVPADESLAEFDRTIAEQDDVAMIYARLDVSRKNFLTDVLLYAVTPDPAADGRIPPLEEAGLISLRRSIFRGSAGSEYGKRLRWNAETRMQPALTPTHYSRNQLLGEGVETFANRSAETTDILHEYFIPRDGIEQFVQDVRRIVPQHEGDLLNVTVRSVQTDEDTVLRYADSPLLSLVMLFHQPRTAAADAKMQTMTRDLIDAALACGGRYYLPYRLHATPEQFARAYPQAAQFFAMKRKYDPEELFVNQFYLRYGRIGSDSAATP